jgi:hypothetical protein
MHATPEFIAAVIFAVGVLLDRYTTLLDRFKKKTPVDAGAELAIADRKIERLEAQVSELRAQKLELVESALHPVLEQLAENARLQSEASKTNGQILERLIHHNGSFKHVEDTLGHIDESFKLMTGFIAGLVELPLLPPNSGS